MPLLLPKCTEPGPKYHADWPRWPIWQTVQLGITCGHGEPVPAVGQNRWGELAPDIIAADRWRHRGSAHMTAPALPMPKPRRRTPLLALGAVALAITSIGSGIFSLAYFTSSATVAANTFTTGTIVIATSPT